MDEPPAHLSLRERRRCKESNGAINFSRLSTHAPMRVDADKKLPPVPGQMTPPGTPVSPLEEPRSSEDQQGLFHNYIRAFCSFDPPAQDEDSEDALFLTAPIRPGDLILVHSVHANGWADGTVLTSGDRGWIPTNYCEAFEHPFLRNLLNAMTQFWDLLGASEEANFATFVRQDYIRGLIAGVRSLLEQADCLHRDGAKVQGHTGVRRMRKGLLADLSTLVQLAKRLQETIGEPYSGEVIHVLLEDLMSKAFRVVTRAVGFVDMWNQEMSLATSSRRARGHEGGHSSSDHERLAIDIGASTTQHVAAALDSGKDFTPASTSKDQSPEVNEHGTGGDASTEEKRGSKIFRPRSGVLAHRLSLVKPPETRQQNGLASERLSKAHDVCISYIGAFIGLYLHPRPSAELVATTDRLVRSCEEMLAIVDEVTAHDADKTMATIQARTTLRTKLEELTKSTKDVFQFSDNTEDVMIVTPEQSAHLVQVSTSLIRSVGECVVKTRQLIEQVGDFELRETSAHKTVTKDEATVTGAQSATERREESERPSPSKIERSLSKKMLPPPPPVRHRTRPSVGVADFAFPLPPTTAAAPMTPVSLLSHHSSSLSAGRSPVDGPSALVPSEADFKRPRTGRSGSISPDRKASVGASVAGSIDTRQSSMRDSGMTGVSEGSTRATTPDHGKEPRSPNPPFINSFASLSSLRSVANTEASHDAEQHLLQKTYAHELTFNKDGQVSGGSLAALVEQLTLHDTAPDPQFLSAFFTTFRLFTSPRELAQTLIARFDYVGEAKATGAPVRLRICNVFKGWLETYWSAEADRDALGDIRFFAMHKLRPHLPAAGERLVDLTRKITAGYSEGTITGPLVSGVGKSSTSIGMQHIARDSVPDPIITKTLLNGLRNAATRETHLSVVDFDPIELARQLTLMASKVFCEIQAEELLSLEWNKKNTSKAQNVRRMCTMNTDLAHVVGDTILSPDDAKKRALVIKHWSKVAMRCLELNNYDSLMAIVCSLNNSVVQRLRRTWECVSKKTRARLDELNSIVDFSRNQASLRRRLESPIAPCLPFLGIYLTDLTFVDAGNPKFRDLQGTTSDSGTAVSVINFDKHLRMAKIVAHVQKYQVPYRLQPIPELQAWLQEHLHRMRESANEMVGTFHRRSLVVEPRQHDAGVMIPGLPDTRRHTEPPLPEARPKTPSSLRSGLSNKTADTSTMSEKFDFFSLRTKGAVKVMTPLEERT